MNSLLPSAKLIFCILAGAALGGCASLSYDQIPGSATEQRQEFTAGSSRVCEVLPTAAASLQWTVDAYGSTPGGCTADLKRMAPWWLPGDDGVRFRLRIAGDNASAGRAVATIEAKRAAPGQLWIERDGQPLLNRLRELAGAAL